LDEAKTLPLIWRDDAEGEACPRPSDHSAVTQYRKLRQDSSAVLKSDMSVAPGSVFDVIPEISMDQVPGLRKSTRKSLLIFKSHPDPVQMIQ
jgi:hypothetical protein